jgi:hypothetical protein
MLRCLARVAFVRASKAGKTEARGAGGLASKATASAHRPQLPLHSLCVVLSQLHRPLPALQRIKCLTVTAGRPAFAVVLGMGRCRVRLRVVEQHGTALSQLGNLPSNEQQQPLLHLAGGLGPIQAIAANMTVLMTANAVVATTRACCRQAHELEQLTLVSSQPRCRCQLWCRMSSVATWTSCARNNAKKAFKARTQMSVAARTPKINRPGTNGPERTALIRYKSHGS